MQLTVSHLANEVGRTLTEPTPGTRPAGLCVSALRVPTYRYFLRHVGASSLLMARTS
jgi:hypothetical protein